MNRDAFSARLARIRPADAAAMDAARRRQAQLAKPPGSLGELETISIRLAGITGSIYNEIEKTRIYVLAADNGVVAEGVSSAPQSVTRQQAVNLTRGVTGASAIARHFGDELVVVDVGIAQDYTCPQIVNRRIARGTKNIAKEPAMTVQQALTALDTGMTLAAQAGRDGVQALGVGEMGIGNTTTSAAVLAALTGCAVEDAVGRGGGVTDEALARKRAVVAGALAQWKPDANDPVDVLAKVGGFDLAAMTGVFLGAAESRLPVVIDGFISVVAALCAVRLCPAARDHLFASHGSFERGYAVAAQALALTPVLTLGMRLGEGSGCPLGFRVLEAACAAMNGMATFDEARIDDGYLAPIREKDCFSI